MRLFVSKENHSWMMIDVQCKCATGLCSWCLPQSRCCPPSSCQSAPSCRPTQERTGVRVHGGIRLIPHIKIQSLSAKVMSLLFRSTSLLIVTNWYLQENQRHPVPLSHMSNCAGSQFDHWVGVANSEVTAITIFVTTKFLVLRLLQGTCNCTYLRLRILFEGSKKIKATQKVENNGKISNLSSFFIVLQLEA